MTASTEILDHESALGYLYGRINYESMSRLPYGDRGLKLDRMRDLLAALEQPQERFPIIHVAGTKGKGSTCAMIAAILTAAGYRTGLYTSPHLERVEERMCVNGQACSDDEFVQLLRQIRPAVDSLDRDILGRGNFEKGPTFFEITTAAAMLHFARQAVDVVVLEVGLGGRLDSTNVCQPELCVITSISFDHTRQLGNTLSAIATEKAGIIKPGVPVISGVTASEPAAVIQQIARQRGCDLFCLGQDFDVQYRRARLLESSNGSPRHASSLGCELDYHESIDGEVRRGERVMVGLPGPHQAANAALAMAVAGRLNQAGWKLTEQDIRTGLREVRSPARTEIVRHRPTVLVDVAHNVASIRALLSVLTEVFSDGGRRTLVFATSRDKDAFGMLRLLLPWFDTVVLTRYLNNPRYVEPARLEEIARKLALEMGTECRIQTAPGPASAWQAARETASADDFICVTGSFFLAAELRRVVAR